MSDSLWEALSPTGAGTIPLCPKLELISVYYIPNPTPLLNCLRNRNNIGARLRHLKVWEVDDTVASELRFLVEELQVFSKPVGPSEKVRLAPMGKPDVH